MRTHAHTQHPASPSLTLTLTLEPEQHTHTHKHQGNAIETGQKKTRERKKKGGRRHAPRLGHSSPRHGAATAFSAPPQRRPE